MNGRIGVPDAFQPGSDWVGDRFANGDRLVGFQIHVAKREGADFSGEITIGEGRKYAIMGTIIDGALWFKSEKKGQFEQIFSGTVRGPEINLNFEGRSLTGGFIEGTATLGLER